MSDATTLVRTVVFVGLAAVAASQEPTPKPSPPGEGKVVGLHSPRTAEDHLNLADEYVGLAASHRKEADLHRRMFAAYERLMADLAAQPATAPKRGKTFPSDKRAKPMRDPLADYRAHCQGYIQAAGLLAERADELADFHRARARELAEAKDP